MQEQSRSAMSSPHMTTQMSPQKTLGQDSKGTFVQAIRDGDYDRVQSLLAEG